MQNYENVTVEVKDNVAFITVDLSKDLGPTKSRRATMIGSTKGWQAIHNEVDDGDDSLIQYSLNLNLVRKP